MPTRDPALSPGEATWDRDLTETDLVSTVLHETRVFLVNVERDAGRAYRESSVLLAGPRAPAPFTLGRVLTRWATVTTAVTDRVARHLPPGPATTGYLQAVTTRVRDHPLPGDVHAAAARVLRDARDRALPNRALARVLRETVGPDPDRGPSPWVNTARRIARTEATAVAARRNLTVIEERGLPGVRWVTRHDERVRPTHAAADGQTQPTGTGFLVGGYTLQFPGDPDGPAHETANCRCVLVGVPWEPGLGLAP